ncbi:MAG: hypothetical protein ACRDS1_05200 [Pseudonocardiaceae bacterium]
MITIRCSTLPISCRASRCCPLLSICRIVVVLAVLVLAVVLALRGYAPAAITGPVLVLVAGAVAAADRLIGVQRVRPVSALPAP